MHNDGRKTDIIRTLREDRRLQMIFFAVVNMGWNLLYGVANGVLGVLYRSGWFYTMCAYYVVLGVIRLYVVMAERRAESRGTERDEFLFAGAGTLFLAVILSLIVLHTISDSVGKTYHIIVMIAIAAVTFFTVVKAVVNAVKAYRSRERLPLILRNVSCVAAVGSILSLERSMLGTFGSSTDRFTYVMEGISGLAGFLIVTALGVSMLLRAKSASDALVREKGEWDGK